MQISEKRLGRVFRVEKPSFQQAENCLNQFKILDYFNTEQFWYIYSKIFPGVKH